MLLPRSPQKMRWTTMVLVTFCWILLCSNLQARTPGVEEEWLRIESGDLTVLTNAEAERGVEIASALQRFRSVFARLAPAIELNSPAPTTLLAFRDHQSYAPFKTVADRGSSRILGQFISQNDGNYLTLNAGTELVSSLAVIHHEYVHYFVRHNFHGVPLWFNEGLAEYYSTFTSEDEAVLIGGAVDRHLTWLKKHGDFSLSEILSADTKSDNYHAPGKVGGFYALSWLMAHYLLSGDSDRLEQAADFFTLLQEGEEATGAFEDAFEIRLSTLEDELRQYVVEGDFTAVRIPLADLPAVGSLQVRRLPPADANFHLGDLLSHIGRRADAEAHFQRALDLHTDHADSLAGMAFLRDLSNRLEEAEILYQESLQQGSVRPQTLLSYGRHLLHLHQVTLPTEQATRQDLAEKAQWALEQAIELKGDYGEAWFLLGIFHGGPTGKPQEGIRALEKAHALLPSRLDVVAQLAQSYARVGRRGAAQGLIEGLLRPRGEVEMVARVEDEVERLLLLKAAQEALERKDHETALDLFDQAISFTRDVDLRRQLEARLLEMQKHFGDG